MSVCLLIVFVCIVVGSRVNEQSTTLSIMAVTAVPEHLPLRTLTPELSTDYAVTVQDCSTADVDRRVHDLRTTHVTTTFNNDLFFTKKAQDLGDNSKYNHFTRHSHTDKGDLRVTTTPDIVEEDEVTNITSCLRENGHFTSFVNAHQLYKARSKGRNKIDNSVSMTCTVYVSTTSDRKLKAVMRTKLVGICYRQNYIVVSDGQKSKEWTKRQCRRKRYLQFTSAGHDMTLEFHVVDISKSYSIEVSLIAMRTSLEVVCWSPTQGYIHTPGNDKWEHYSELMDTWQHFSPPLAHVTLLSMSRLWVQVRGGECVDVVEVYEGETTTGNMLWSVCGTSPPRPKVLDTRQVHVHFKSDSNREYLGFRLRFSFHSTYYRPTHDDDGLWNCSVPEWPRFQRHFLCNMDRECQQWEDEAKCSYSGHCGQGYLTLDKSCYKYVSSEKPLSWETASFSCLAQGGLLASLNTPREWNTVTEFLKTRQIAKDVFVGLKSASPVLPTWYRYSWQWTDGSIAYYMSIQGRNGPYCGKLTLDAPKRVQLYTRCSKMSLSDFLCEFASMEHNRTTNANASSKETGFDVRIASLSTLPLAVPHVECPGGHLTHDFMACDEQSKCWSSHRAYDESGARGEPFRESCSAPMTSLPAMFPCRSGLQRVPYTLVCDHRKQCADGSDESFCVFPSCSGARPLQCRASAQCVGRDEFCDSTHQCVDQSDESECLIVYSFTCPNRPSRAVMNFEPASLFTDCTLFRYDSISRRHGSGSSATPCPRTHFLCADDSYCLPVYLRCNRVVDCPGREDEAACELSICPGFYRCRASLVCLHVNFVCDGVRHCPEQDDELHCHYPPCPPNCTCYGMAFTCRGPFLAEGYPELRYLNANSSGMRVSQLKENAMLVYLNLTGCGVQGMEDLGFGNLRILDVSDNNITVINVKHLSPVANLQILILSGNPLSALGFADLNLTMTHNRLESIDLSLTTLEEIDFNHFTAFPNVFKIKLAQSQVRKLYWSSNRSLTSIRVLDLRQCHVTMFERDVLSNLDSLDTVFAENYELCCPWVLPAVFNPKNCHAPPDSVASCSNLLASPLHRILLALCCCCALLANTASFVWRVFVAGSSGSSSTDIFVTHVSVADAALGLCVAVVVVSDQLRRGSYALEDREWRSSVSCKTAGFLFVLSSQVCVSLTFVVTFDRLLSLSSPTRAHAFTPASSHVVCTLVWAGSAVLAALPVLVQPAVSTEVFGQTAACFPLLGTQEPFTQALSAIFVVAVLVFSSLLTSFTAVGQIYVNAVVVHHKNSKADVGTRHILRKSNSVTSGPVSSEATFAGRVFSSCMLNVACWLPLNVLAVLAWRGSPLPDALHVLVGMLAVPATAALRPAVYALRVRGEHRRRQRTQRLRAYIAAQHRQRGQKCSG